MIKLGYFAAHEQRNPIDLLRYAIQSEKIGLDAVWSSDHFHPWAHTNASSGFAWNWISVVAATTNRIKVGTGVTAPILRYHPAIVAQSFATLDYMFPGRIFLGLGTGEAMNEVPLGYEWPPIKERIQRLKEAVQVIKLLWTGEFVDFRGKYYELKKARLYTAPKKIPIYIASCGVTTAKLAGKYADGFLTLPQPDETHIQKLLRAMESAAVEAGRDPGVIERVIEIEVSYDEDFDKALSSCRFWSGTKIPNCLDVADPRELEERGKKISEQKLLESWLIFTDAETLFKEIERYVKLGFNYLVFLSSSPNEEKFLKILADRVVPYVSEVYK